MEIKLRKIYTFLTKLYIYMNKWDFRFMKLAEETASWSKDIRTKVGAIVVDNDNNPISFGFNGLPRKVNDLNEERYLPENKYYWTIHSEINALINTCRHNQCTKDCTMYVTLYPCSNCAGAIVNAGIKRIVCKNKPDFNHERWGVSWNIAQTIFNEAGIIVDFIISEE